MTYIQFHQPSALDKSKLIECCGDRGVIIYDGRMCIASILADAAIECSKRGYSGYQLFRGETFCRSHSVTSIFRL